jgi:two-component system sensor histidine kinase YesM
MRQGSLPENLDLLSGSDHVGIYNIYRRLRLRYGQSASLGIDSIEGEGTTVTISFPLEAQP